MAQIASSSVSRPDDACGSFVMSGAVTVVALRGEHDGATVPALADLLAAAMAAGDAEVVVDVSHLEFMDSATLRVLEHAAVFLTNRSRQLVIRSPSPFTWRLLQLCGAGALVHDTPPDRPEPRSARMNLLDPAIGLATIDADARPGMRSSDPAISCHVLPLTA